MSSLFSRFVWGVSMFPVVYDTSEYLVGDPSAWIMVLDVNEGYSTLPRFLAWLESDVKK